MKRRSLPKQSQRKSPFYCSFASIHSWFFCNMDDFGNACDESSGLLSGGHSMSGAVEDHDEFCPICSDTMLSPCITTCGHRFCSHCLVQSLRMKRPWNRGPCPICRSAVSVHSTLNALTGQCLEEPVATTIFGSTYLQGGRLGVASYDVPSRFCKM